MSRVDVEFKLRVYELIKVIPKGKVVTYGQVAAVCGAPWAAWEVGQIAHYGPIELPWHRMVNKQGGLASGFVPGGREQQKMKLEKEGIKFDKNDRVNMELHLWQIKIGTD